MKQQTLIIVAAALAIGVFFFSDFFSSSDEKKIKHLLGQIEETLEFSEPLGAMQIAGRVRDLQALIDPDIESELTWNAAATRTYQGFDTIKTGALVGSKMVKSHALTTIVSDINVNGNKATARVQVISVGVDASGESFRERAVTDIGLVKTESDWTVDSVSVTDER